MENIVINWVINGTLLTGALASTLYFFRKWMDKREKAEEKITNENKESLKELKKDFKDEINKLGGKIGDNKKFYSQTYEELKIQIRENKEFYQTVSEEIKERIQQLVEYQREANGRTGKLEINLQSQIAVCQERHSDKLYGRRITDMKDNGGV